jgi:surface antigen
VRATTAPIGDRIIWNDSGASGSVTAVRDGTSTQGRYCREFQQQVTVGGRTEQAYGTACQQPDGAWEIVSTGD